MRLLEIQRGKEGMKSQQFNKEVGATAGCTLRLLLNTILLHIAGVKHGIRGDAWFGSIQTAMKWHNEAMKLFYKSNNTMPASQKNTSKRL
jgi:hypothetical protein